jgi:hypothetical protein
MGLLDRLQNGVAAGAQTASEAFMAQFKSQVEQERQEALILAQESSRIRTAEAEAGIQLDTRQKSFDQDEANSGLLRKRKVADEKAVGDVRNSLEREVAKNKMADEFEFKKKNAKDIAGIERMIAQARHIVDPSIDLIPNGDGTFMRYDKRAGKSLGVLTDPETGKALVGPKDISQGALAAAKLAGEEGLALMKDTTNPDSIKQGQLRVQQAIGMLTGGKPQTDEFEKLFPAKSNPSDSAKTEQQPTVTPTKQPLLSPAERKARASTEASAEDIKQHEESVAARKQRIAEEKSKRDEEIRRRNEKRDKEREAMNRLSRIRD